MTVSLEQAIVMHAKALKRQAGGGAPRVARAWAERCAASGDREGHAVWLRVAASADALLNFEAERR